ncbi:stabilin-2 isoform X2 [Scleropages formosus]|uniref:stabilin-2 isoform X2 n=1 Tax=Scleropages formosus TaxID=113540 RepID=UPI0010FAA43C|nr:stabilin-2 isoform X2 [Scleropages formosus]
MTERPRRRSDGLLLALVPCLALLLWLDCCPAAAAVQKNRCDTPAAITTKQCNSCLKLRNCPVGFKLNGSSAGRQDCRYIFNPLSKISVSLVGCSYECYKEVLEPQCCPGHWGYDCLECPTFNKQPCGNNGMCSDGITGNGTCSCNSGFVGTACEDCEENRYGPTCSSVCSCVHGICNRGINGDGRCTCFSGYKAPDCTQELPKCAALGCSSNGRCIEDAHTGVLACRCLPGYEGDGTRCTPINPCMQKVCHQNAVCSILGPNQYSCTCAEGYQGDGKVCMPVDPCQTNLGGCPVDSTRCVYDGPGKSHCECQDGFENLVPGIGCSLTDICQPSSCDKNANCTTIKPGVVECICHEGYRGDGKTCYGNIMQQLQELNTNPKGQWCNQLTNAITLFKSSLSWPLSSLGPFTIFVPINKGFKGTSVKTLVADQVGARYLSKLHMVAGELTLETLKRGDVFYTLTGKSAESIVSDGDQLVKIRIHGSRKKGDVLDSDILASNGVIHIISKLMDSVAPTVKSEKEENLMKILTDNGKFSKFRDLLERSNMAHLLDDPSPYTLFVPTDAAMNVMKEGYLDYLCSDQGKAKLLELLRNHIIPSVKLEVVNMVSTESFMSMANQPLAFNVTSNGQILVNEQAILEADVEAKNGRLYSVDGVLIPSSIEPVLPHRCDVTKYSIIKGLCVSCTQVTKSICPSGEPLNTFQGVCIFRRSFRGIIIPVSGCSLSCNHTETIPLCCEGFFGPDCSACPGGFTKPCSGHGKCMDGLEGNGTCVCDENFRGSRCQYCSRPDKHGPNCDKTCPCIHGQCDNRPESDGACKVDSCQMGFTGRFCERNTKACGPNAQFCHAYAECDFNEKAKGTIRCVCKPGYQGDGITCAEMDSCAPPHRGGCGVNAKCVKTGPQTHVCQCLTGWRADGDECQAINNCLEPNRGGCHDNATCIYVGPGQSDCECKNGFRGNGHQCEPINQCVSQNGGCHYLATCQYLGPGHWKCVCEDGYEGDGQICYGTVAQELLGIPEAAEFSKWVNDAGLNQMLSETQNFTLFLPSSSAVENMAKEDKDFWTEQSNLASIVKYHMVHGVHQLVDLRNRTFPPQLASFLKNWLPISRANETMIGDSTIISADIAATNGLIHVIDSVLVPNRKLSEGLTEQLSQRPEFSMFRQYLIQYNLTQEIEESSAYTVFAPTDSAIGEYLKKTGNSSLTANITRYHIVLSDKLMQKDLRDGTYLTTMLGFNFQVGIFLRDNRVFVNDALVNLTDVETDKGVIHGLSSVLEIVKNRCDSERSLYTLEPCQDCFSKIPCPPGMTPVVSRLGTCLFKRTFESKQLLTLGCRAMCKKKIIKRQCCAGYFGDQCEPCPGPVGLPCFGNGACHDGTNGTGVCRCSKGFDGTACESCQTGKYGMSCDQECQCVQGRCSEGPQGTGACECDMGWRGVNCDTVITQDTCKGKCHTSANCLMLPDGSSTCKCAAGFEGNGTYCSVVDACKDNNGGCSANAICKQTLPGRRRCVCHTGYTGDGLVCVEINPCLAGNADCHVNAMCLHTGPNKAACMCHNGYSGDGKTCAPIDLCQKRNGGCHALAQCEMTGPDERNCSCKEGYTGDGLTCKGTVFSEIFHNRKLREFFFQMTVVRMNDLRGNGPFTVFAPNTETFRKESLREWRVQGVMPHILRNHIVACRTLHHEELKTPRNVTTLHGETLSITYSQGDIYINNKAKVVFADDVSLNGIIYEIDAVLLPESVQRAPKGGGEDQAQNLTDLAKDFGYKTFSKLLEDTGVLNLLYDHLHQPVTLFWPTDRAMDSLPQAQKDFLYNNQNRAQLVEYLKYHVVRDAEVQTSDLVYSTLTTLQGSELRVTCGEEDRIGDLFLNDRKCRIVRRHMAFNGGIAYGIDCLLTPPSLGGRCDTTNVLEIKAACGQCSRSQQCPPGSKLKEISKCGLPNRITNQMMQCQSICSVPFRTPKCCPGYYGRDCLACPGGPESPCGSRGKCDEGHLGNGTCTCDPGFRGAACELCLEGHYGSSCQTCNCTEHGSCDRGRMGTGSCFCDQGWTGPRCESQLAAEPACTPACSPNAVCKANNTCECKPFYDGDGIACTVADLCKLNNGGCSKVAKCTQKGVKVTCACLKGYQGDGHACAPINLCSAADGGGCHEHATCTMLGPGKKKCECKSGYIGDGVTCEVKELPINRCAQDNGQCNVDALCTDLHYEDKKMGVFHLRSPKGQYKLTYAEAQDACRKDGAVIASYTQLSYAQQAGFSLCSAGWLENARVGYPTTFSSLTCGFGHVGIVDYGTRANLSETWDVFCYRVKDVSCACKAGYVGDGYTCSGNLMQVLASRPIFSNFLSQIINYSSSSELGKEFVKRLSNLSIQSTLFVPDNNGLYENQTLSTRDIEYHLSDGGAVCFQDMTNGTRIRTRLGHSLRVLGIANFTNPSVLTPMRYINDRFIVEWDILASNGIIHVLQGPLHAPPPEPEFHKGHQVGVGLGVLLVALLVAVAGFAGYRFYTQNSKPFHFHYFKDNEDNDAAVVVSDPNISNPVYESGSSQGLPDEDKHHVVDGGAYDLLQDS